MSLDLEHTHLSRVTGSEKITDTRTSDGHLGAFAALLVVHMAAFALLKITRLTGWFSVLGPKYGLVLKPPDRR